MSKPRTLGGKLRELREKKELSQREIANMIGILTESYSKWERDAILKIDTERLQKLADFYGVTVDYLLKSEYNLDHLPKEIQDFVRDPEAKDILIETYIKYKEEQLKKEIEAIKQFKEQD